MSWLEGKSNTFDKLVDNRQTKREMYKLKEFVAKKATNS